MKWVLSAATKRRNRYYFCASPGGSYEIINDDQYASPLQVDWRMVVIRGLVVQRYGPDTVRNLKRISAQMEATSALEAIQ